MMELINPQQQRPSEVTFRPLYLKSGTLPSYDAATATRDAHIDTDVRTHPPSNMKLNSTRSNYKHVPRQRQAC